MKRVVYNITVELGDSDKALIHAEMLKDWSWAKFGSISGRGDTVVYFRSETLDTAVAVMTYCEMCLVPQPGFSITVTRSEVD
jgi:hypothetical protein